MLLIRVWSLITKFKANARLDVAWKNIAQTNVTANVNVFYYWTPCKHCKLMFVMNNHYELSVIFYWTTLLYCTQP